MTTSGVNNPSFSFNDQCDGASYSLKKFDQRPKRKPTGYFIH